MRSIYRYGLMAWVWRTLIAGALTGGATCLVSGARLGEPMPQPFNARG